MKEIQVPKVPQGSCLFLRRGGKDGNLDRVLDLYGWLSAYWQPVACSLWGRLWTTVYSSPRLSFGGDCDTLCSGHRAKQAMTLKAGNAVQVLGQADMIECL